ncbi:MAG: calcium/sodium antiporter [Candidatus Omnitrophota bacterium]
MEMGLVPALLFLLAAFLIIFKGAGWFVISSVRIAEGFHIPKVLVGATIVSLVTVSPELLVSAIAAFLGKTEMAIGNAVGSPINNIGFTFAACVCFTFIPVEGTVVRNQGLMMLGSVILLFLLGLRGYIDRPAAIFFLTLGCLYLWYSVRMARSAIKLWNENNKGKTENRQTVGGGFIRPAGVINVAPTIHKKGNPYAVKLRKDLGLFFLGAALVVAGSRLLILSGTALAKCFGVSETVIGLTLVSFGTSLPEFFTSITALTKGHREISAGNIIGANILDIVCVLGVAGLIRPLPINIQTQFFALPILIILSSLFLIFGSFHKGFVRWEGAVLLSVFAFYCFVLFTS